MNKLKILFAVIMAFGFTVSAYPQITIEDFLEKIQDNINMTTDVKARVMFTEQKVDQGTKVIDSIYYRRDSDDSFLIVMVGPESEKGNGYLRSGDNFWMYRRNTRTFQHINRDENIGGTDARGGDFEKRKLPELYEGKRLLRQRNYHRDYAG